LADPSGEHVIFDFFRKEKGKSMDAPAMIQFLENIIMNLKLWMAFLDPDGNILIWNLAAEDITGYTRDEVLGKNEVWRWIYPDQQYRREITKRIVDIIQNRRYLENFETQILTKWGLIRQISWNTRELTGSDGKLLGYIAVGNDISEKVQAKREIREQAELFRGITAAASDAIVLLNHAGLIAYWNPAAEHLFGADADAAMKNNFFLLFSPAESAGKDQLDFKKFSENGGGPFAGKNRELRLQKTSGEIVHTEISLSAVSIHGIWNAIAIIRDISGRIRAELHERETQMNAVIQGSPIPQFMIDRDHRIIFWNRALEVYTGIRAGDVIGTTQQWRAFYDTERPCMADLLLDGAIEEIPRWYTEKYNKSRLVEGAYEATDFFPRLGAEGKWLYFTGALIRDSKGEVIGALETLEDITEVVGKKP
jgi:PAS domain S-box-containing protein